MLSGRNVHTASASVFAISASPVPNTEFSELRISSMTAVFPASSRSTYSEQVTPSAPPGGGASDDVRGVEVRGDDVVGRDDVDVLVDGPASVVIATVPGVVRSQPAMAPATTNVAAATRTRNLICEP